MELPPPEDQSIAHELSLLRGEVGHLGEEISGLSQIIDDLKSIIIASQQTQLIGGPHSDSLMSIPDESNWLSASVAANQKQISISAMRKAAATGLIPGSKKIGHTWFLSREEVDKFTPRPMGRPRKDTP